MASAAPQHIDQDTGARRMALADLMKFEILMNDKSHVWVFHDQTLPGRLAWVEFDPATGRLDMIPHDMRDGIVYADVPSSLHNKVRASDLVYFYMTAGNQITGFQKAPIHVRRV